MKDYKILLSFLHIEPKNVSLYIQALTHPSYENEVDKKAGNYQRLEFLGDAVLEHIVSDYIYEEYKDMQEGKMTLLRSNLVKEEPLSEMARYINLGDYLLLGKGEEKSKGYEKSSILCDVFESLLAAIYLDLGYHEAKKFALRNIKRYIKEKTLDYLINNLKDPKTRLQEHVQAEVRKTVEWNTVQTSGTANKPIFTSKVILDGIVLGVGNGTDKTKAEEAAAEDALGKMAK